MIGVSKIPPVFKFTRARDVRRITLMLLDGARGMARTRLTQAYWSGIQRIVPGHRSIAGRDEARGRTAVGPSNHHCMAYYSTRNRREKPLMPRIRPVDWRLSLECLWTPIQVEARRARELETWLDVHVCEDWALKKVKVWYCKNECIVRS